jgi:hypothetical protein
VAPTSEREASTGFISRVARLSEETREELRPPLHWPTLSHGDAACEWPELFQWVQDLRERYESFDEKTLPPCWFRHPCYVGALQALKDFERVAYAKNAPGSAGVDWHRALRDLESMITRWSAGPVACVAGHKESKRLELVVSTHFADFVNEDLVRRGNAGM